MKKIFIAGSRKFQPQIVALAQSLTSKNIAAFTTMEKEVMSDSKNLSLEKQALFKAFKMIEDSDLVYIVCPGGYIGKTVAMEIAYAYSKGKPIVSSEQIKELSARALIKQIQTIEEL